MHRIVESRMAPCGICGSGGRSGPNGSPGVVLPGHDPRHTQLTNKSHFRIMAAYTATTETLMPKSALHCKATSVWSHELV
jgi:hypothetical protein